MTLNDIVKFLVFLLDRERIDLCFCERGPWHALFYDLKRLPPTSGVPLTLRDTIFGGGPPPVCKSLDDCLDALFIDGRAEWSLPDLRTYRLSEGTVAIWATEFGGLKPYQKDFLSRVALGYARDHFPAKIAA